MKLLSKGDADIEVREATRARSIETDLMLPSGAQVVSKGLLNSPEHARPSYSAHRNSVISDQRIENRRFPERICLNSSAANTVLHTARMFISTQNAGSPRTNPKHPKHPWEKLGAS
jgi:hypothetical protein